MIWQNSILCLSKIATTNSLNHIANNIEDGVFVKIFIQKLSSQFVDQTIIDQIANLLISKTTVTIKKYFLS